MALKIRNHSAGYKLENTRFLFYSSPKLGKTTLMSGWPDCLILATEKGYGALSCQVADIKDWEEFEEAVDEIVAEKFKIQIVAIDTIDILWQQCTTWVCEYMGIEHVSEAGFGKAYHMIDDKFFTALRKLFSSSYGILMSSHTINREVIRPGGTITKVVSSLPDRGRNIVTPMVDVIGYMDIKNIKTTEGKWVEARTMTFKPSATLECGDRTKKLPAEMVIPKDPKQAYQIFQNYFLK